MRSFAAICAVLFSVSLASAEDANGNREVRASEREHVLCPAIHRPVCAQKQVTCVRAPCPPIARTYSNACLALADGASIVHEGECIEREGQ